MKALNLKELSVSLTDSNDKLLDGINLAIAPGEVHLLMGPNGSGKSTLAKTLAGHPAYAVTAGEINLDGTSLVELSPDERSRLGLMLLFQYPVEVPGVKYIDFLRQIYNLRQDQPLSPLEFQKLANSQAADLGINPELLERGLNEDFSGGEKKMGEVLQLALLKPKYAILDETDSGLDVDALKQVFTALQKLIAAPDYQPGILLITHYHRVLSYLQPDHVHVMQSGEIVRSGGPKLAAEIDKQGYK